MGGSLRFSPRKGEGWASRKDIFFIRKFRAEHDPKDGFHLVDYQNHSVSKTVGV